MRSPYGACGVDSSPEVVETMLLQHEIVGRQRFLAQHSIGPMPHETVMRTIERRGTAGAPAFQKRWDTRPRGSSP